MYFYIFGSISCILLDCTVRLEKIIRFRVCILIGSIRSWKKLLIELVNIQEMKQVLLKKFHSSLFCFNYFRRSYNWEISMNRFDQFIDAFQLE